MILSLRVMILSLRVILTTAFVLCIAVVMMFSLPLITDIRISRVPWIWNLVTSWLRPPYIYLVINCIVIAIVASSKLQHYFKFNREELTEPIKSPADMLAVAYGGDVLDNKLVEVTIPSKIRPESLEVNDEFEVQDNTWEIKRAIIVKDVPVDEANYKVNSSANNMTRNANYLEDMDDFVISESPWNALNEISKPPASSRLNHQKLVKANHEGGKMLEVSNHRRLDTLENSWKAITDGRPMPLTRHLRKSDTWATHQHSGSGKLQDHKTIITSKTFNEQRSRNSNNNILMTTVALSSDSGNLRRDPSLSQEELNKQAEAFINKFKEDMRLQRKESLNRYMEMINSGAY